MKTKTAEEIMAKINPSTPHSLTVWTDEMVLQAMHAYASQGAEAVDVEQQYNKWLEETKRGGSVLVGSSLREFFAWLRSQPSSRHQQNGMELPLEWSPVESERLWQQQQFKVIFPRLENNQPNWQRLNFFINAGLKFIGKLDEQSPAPDGWVREWLNDDDMMCLKLIRNHFGEKDASNFQRMAYSLMQKLIDYFSPLPSPHKL